MTEKLFPSAAAGAGADCLTVPPGTGGLARRPYETPRLVRVGSLRDLLGKTGPCPDMSGNFVTKPLDMGQCEDGGPPPEDQ